MVYLYSTIKMMHGPINIRIDTVLKERISCKFIPLKYLKWAN